MHYPHLFIPNCRHLLTNTRKGLFDLSAYDFSVRSHFGTCKCTRIYRIRTFFAHASKKSEDPLAFSVLYGFYTAFISLIILFFEPWRFGDITPKILLITFIATVLFGIMQAAEFLARKYLEASRMTILFQLTPVITFFAAVLFINETFSTEKLLAILLIFAGNVVAIVKHGGHITRNGLLFGLLTVVSLGFAYIADKSVFEFYPIGLYVALTYFAPSIYVLLFISNRVKRVREEFHRTKKTLPVLAAISVLGYYMLLKNFSLTEASVAVPIIYTSTIFTAFGGIFILKEKSNILQKIIGAIVVFAGVLMLR